MTRSLPALALSLALGLWPATGMTQDASPPQQGAILLADDVRLMADDRLVASGNVEAMYDNQRLQAKSITYDQKTDTLMIEGPIILQQGDSTLVLADAGELDREMRNGLLTGARVVLESQVQLAANAMVTVEGRYSQLYKTAVTSCRICETGRPPLWQIRARKVVHDQQERQLYFSDAQLRVLDMPVLYLPRLRLPDPTLERATGFLLPSIINSSLLGTGLKLPYFIKIGDHRDLTLTPFLTNKSRTLEFRYRQAFHNGDLLIRGAVTDDDIGIDPTRGYLFAIGRFDLKRDFELTFDVEVASDDAYLFDYGYSYKDWLDSEIAIERARRDEFIRGALTYYHSQRLGQSNSTLPTIVGNAQYEKRLFPERIGGELRFGAQAHGHYRSSDLRTDGADLDIWADGRDMLRFTASADWLRNWALPSGVLAEVQAGLAIDHFDVTQGGGIGLSSATEVTPSTSVQLRWPLVKSSANGVTQVIEPVAQLSWVGGSNPAIPNDESTQIEFDEGNLFSLSRYSAPDRRERGLNAAYGVQWTRFDPDGWEASLAFGQVFRNEREIEATGVPSLTDSSGLQDRFSDVLFAGQYKTQNGLTFTARGLFDDGLKATKAEARASWYTDRTSLSGTYIWLRNDPAEQRPDNVSEWSFSGSYRLARHWTGRANWRYDVARDIPVSSGLGLTYTNECVELSVNASRWYSSSTILQETTNITFTVALLGFTTKTQENSYTRTCKN
ncbi:organic solvent tolerance protein, putative [Roseobacter sp. AzwK-3b]|uniref:LPS-assembly protein LptD n=1 Tax=Roseobacter sp. AzwK-3b TaxID=351016 RepID=UPI00015695F3|nr:LPS assembly protein LptD [Roseobacter sp. AzwK-3b]EDM71284.1 organic solvent tolerance protein, putative [Roseobacter sp. AzwK-3b]